MYEFVRFRSRGQTVVLVALAVVAIVAFVALAIDGGNAYGIRRDAQSAADGAAIAGTWVLVEYSGESPKTDVLRRINTWAQANGVADTDGDPSNAVNGNILAWYVHFDGSYVMMKDAGGNDVPWEIHAGLDEIPSGAKGVEVQTSITKTTFFARAIGVSTVGARARATAVYTPDGGILPIAVNEYWAGSQGKCPYANCEEPYSFVRDPSQLPPFSTDGGGGWIRNFCANPYNNYTCQGAYGGYGENFGKAFAMLGGDAKPNHGSTDPRSFVHLDYRYDAIVEEGGDWHYLAADDQWVHYVKPNGKKDEMAAVIRAGGYSKVPIPIAVHEPPPLSFIDGWAYCWGNPNEGKCFNYPAVGMAAPYGVVQSLSGTDAAKMAQEMYDNGRYVDGRFAPGQQIVIMVYNGFSSQQWGKGGVNNEKDDAAVIVGYFGAIIVGYGNDFDSKCETKYHPTPGNWTSYVPCISGNEQTVYGLASGDAPLVIDPSQLINNFLPKKIYLIK